MRPASIGYNPFKVTNGDIAILKGDAETPYKDLFTGVGDDVSILNNMDEDERFFYVLSLHDKPYVEYGVGHIARKCLVRETILQTRIEDILQPARSPEPHRLDNGYGVLNCIVPEDYRQLMKACGNAVLSSSPDGMPFPLELPEGTVVGNVDGDIDAVGSEGLATILMDKIHWLLSKVTGAVSLPVRILDLTDKDSLVLASQVRLKPRSRPKKAQPGTVIYNSRTDSLEIRTKEGWKKI